MKLDKKRLLVFNWYLFKRQSPVSFQRQLTPNPKIVLEVIQSLYPSGTYGVDSSSILRAVFIDLKSRERRSAG